MKRDFVATVKEGGLGQPSINIELHKESTLPGDKTLVFDFPEGTPHEVARMVANTINQNVGKISFKAF